MKRQRKFYAADLFCGAGGTSTGLMQMAAALGVDLDLVAVNHWDTALATHAANHPDARHFNDPIDKLKPHHAVPGGKLDLLWASPECTNHSKAKGGRPRDEQSRATGWDVLKWVQELYVKTLCIENVPEIMEWGPLGANGKPLMSRRGDTFRAWLNALHSLGYRTQYKVLNCANYGDATTRERFFMIAHRGREALRWPKATHATEGKPDLFGSYKPWKTARQIIDWNIPGHSIFATRAQGKAHGINIVRPLAANTIKRIEAGIRKFWGAWAEPFLIVLNGGGWSEKAITLDTPLPTIVAGGMHVGIAQPFFFGQQSCSAARTSGSPIPTISTGGAIQMVQPFLASVNHEGNHDGRVYDGSSPLGVVTTKNGTGVVQPFLVSFYGNGDALSVNTPLDTVTTKDRFGLCNPVLVRTPDGGQYLFDILFRMLTPTELAAAHSFPSDYKFCGNKSEIVKQIGNSVPVETAKAVGRAAMANILRKAA